MISVRTRSLLALAALSVGTTPAGGQSLSYHVTKTIALAGDGGWDYLTVDPATKRLYITRGQARLVQVVDLKTGTVAGTIDSTPGVHGVALVPELNRGFTSNGADSTVTIFDLRTLKLIDRITVTGRNPDAILYDPFTRRVFTFNHTGRSTTAIDAATGKVLGTAKTDGVLESGQSDLAGTIFVNDEDGNRLFAFDATTLEVKAAWMLDRCQAPTGLAIDRQHKRLFASCSASHTLAIVDYATGKVVATPDICSGTDAAVFDPGLQLVFASCGDGNITVIHEDSPDRYTVLGNIPTEPRARTMALDEETHTLYTVTARFEPPPNPPPAEGPRRGPMIPGSFHLLVVER